MRIDGIQNTNERKAQTLNQYTNSVNGAENTSVFVSSSVDSNFANSAIEQYEALSDGNRKVENVVILSNSEAKEIDTLEGLDDETKGIIKDYINGGANDAYGFYTKKGDTIVLIQGNHERKDTNYEGSLTEQGADTITHEYAHLIDTNCSTDEEFQAAYLADLKAIEKQLEENPDAKIAGSDMTYREAMVYFDHYYEGADFSDGIDETDVTRRGLRENFAEGYSTVFDNKSSEVNKIYEELFPNSTNKVREIFA